MNMRSIALENINPEIISQRQPQSKLIMGLRYDLYKNEIHSFNSQQDWHGRYYAAVAIRQLVLWNNSLWFPSTNEFSALPRRALRKAHQAMWCNGKPLQARSWPFTAGFCVHTPAELTGEERPGQSESAHDTSVSVDCNTEKMYWGLMISPSETEVA